MTEREKTQRGCRSKKVAEMTEHNCPIPKRMTWSILLTPKEAESQSFPIKIKFQANLSRALRMSLISPLSIQRLGTKDK